MKIRLATRASALALIQAEGMIAQLKTHNPQAVSTIVPITKLAGDQDKHTALAEIQKTGLFSKEIDEALLNDEADCALHCLKDLGTDRPAGLAQAAILKRLSPHDVLLANPSFLDKMATGKPVVLGTSSPRRMELAADCLNQIYGTPSAKKNFRILRGNVDTRIRKVANGDYDAIILAFAGLARLFQDEKARQNIAPFFTELKMMILPLHLVPGAPGQGALCVEYAQKTPNIGESLAVLNDSQTEILAKTERTILKEYGGGCHERFGVTALSLPHISSPYVIIRGRTKNGDDISHIRCEALTEIARPDRGDKVFFSPLERNHFITETSLPLDDANREKLQKAKAIFIAHKRAVTNDMVPLLQQKKIFVSGLSAWQAMAEKEIHVTACADGFGFAFLQPLFAEKLLELPPLSHNGDWLALTHADGCKTWEDIPALASYQIEKKADISPAWLKQLGEYRYFYWGAASHYHFLKEYLPDNATHYCGIGKTAESLIPILGKRLIIVPDKSWLQESDTTQKSRGMLS